METTIKEMKIAGKSYAEIAKAIGKSRSAVAGRFHRMGPIKKVEHFLPKIFKPKINKFNRPIEAYTAYGEPVTLKDCEGCRFPVEGTKLFCNAGILANDYCADHRRICYTKVKK